VGRRWLFGLFLSLASRILSGSGGRQRKKKVPGRLQRLKSPLFPAQAPRSYSVHGRWKSSKLAGRGTGPMKILVVDDHVLIRQAMHGLLKKVRRDAVVLEAPSSEKAMRTIAEHPDVSLILLDLSLPDRDGFCVLADLREQFPAIAVVVVSAVHDPGNVRKALELGALGYIPKSAQGDVILGALRLVISGGIYVPPEILIRSSSPMAVENYQYAGISDSSDYMGLTERQLEVLGLMMQGKSNKTICRILELAEPTVKNHVTAILKTLNVTNRTEAVVAANNLGWKLRVPSHVDR
jgi:DNA-binding NarL/FixJ family response regulator